MTDALDFVEANDLELLRSGDDQVIALQVQSAIRSYCGWHIARDHIETVTLDGCGSNHLWLPTLMLHEVTAVTSEGETVDLDDIDWSKSGYLVNRAGCWSSRPRQTTVTIRHGYELPPEDVVGVAASVALRAASSPAGTVRESTGPFSIQYATTAAGVAGGIAFLEHERAILDRYRLPSRP